MLRFQLTTLHLILLITSSGFLPTQASVQDQELMTDQEIPRTPITIKLEIPKAPKLNEDVLVKCTVKSVLDAPSTIAKIELPEGAIKIGGNINWEGDLVREVSIVFSARIKFIAEGNWIIKATAIHMIDEQNSWGDADSIYLNVSKNSGKFGFSDSHRRGKAKTKRIP